MLDLTPIARAEHILGIVAGMLLVGLFASWLARRLHLPDLILFLVAGLLLGPHAGGLLQLPPDSVLEPLILGLGASYILFEGGMDVRLGLLRDIGVTVTLLATLGVLITAAVVAVTAHAALGMDWMLAALLGASIAATDPAALIPMFTQIHISERLTQAVICEAAFNDAVSAVLTFALLGAVAGGTGFSPGGVALGFATQAGLGVLVGAGVGMLAAIVVGHARYGFLRAYAPLVMLVTVIGAYVGADRLHGSGFMAVFIAGVVVGNRETFGLQFGEDQARRLDEYVDSTSLIMRMVVFMLVGAKIDPAALQDQWSGTLACIAALVLVARPLAVLACALPDRRARWSWHEVLFMFWTRETGVIPAALAGMLLTSGLPDAPRIAAVIFAAILVTILLQGSTTRWLAGRLGLLEQ